MWLNEINNSNPNEDFETQDEYNPMDYEKQLEIMEREEIDKIRAYWSEKRFDLVLEWWNENSPTFEEMEEYFSIIIKEKYIKIILI